ncbi:MAG: NAD(P)H-binding protein [Polyangiaceae bacterium]|nr:NAD(P)H-binding protein [Polyangiaceae bacterium]
MRQEGFRAVVLGATGLVGRDLVAQLLLDEKVESVTTIVRRASGREHSKLREHLVDFEDQSWTDLVQGDLLFSALGTTLRVAGSQSAQRRVDLDYQQWAAEAGARQGIKAYALVSSTGADERSSFFIRV